MNNLERLEMEIGLSGVEEINKYSIYLEENGLDPLAEYDTQSKTNLKGIYKSALNFLESVANDPKQMKNYKTEDLTITHFHTNLLKQIDNLQRKIRQMVDDDFVSDSDAKFIYLF